jgi:glycosyltransferase involved in cell wall biosynthesis
LTEEPGTAPAGATDDDLRLEVERRLPESLSAGRGDALFVFGTCFHRHAKVVGLEVLVDGVACDVTDFGLPRLDLFRRLHPGLGGGEPPVPPVDPDSLEDPEVHCYRSGFWATVPVPPIPVGGATVLAVRAQLDDGSTTIREFARIEAAEPALPPLAAGAGTGELIAVAMATFNPDMDLFRAQVESLRAQTDTDWVCVVNDDRSRPDRFREIAAELEGDHRFVLSRADRRLGFYRSFERALELVPDDAALVALCDQDDRWYPDKLATLRRELGGANLIYSDQRLVDTEGRVLAETYWTSRPNNHTNLLSLLIANTVTGAASLMRREVVERALPFPEVPGEQYHDHWLGLVAMTLGDVAYVDRPLYDYVQHGGAALGHAAANAGIAGKGRLTERLRLAYWRGRFAASHAAYFRGYLRLEVLAQTLLARCGDAAPRPKRSALGRFIRADRSRLGVPWLRLRAMRKLAGRGETLGVEKMLAESLLWRHVMEHHSRDWERPIGSPFDASMPPSPGEAMAEAFPDPETAHIERLLAPLELTVSAREPQRVNLLIPTIDLQHLFGGYIGKFNLARKLAEAGHRVRIVTVDPTPPLPDDWREQVEAYSGLAGALSRIEVAFARDQAGPLAVNPDDRFVATTWWTAYHARNAVQQTNGDRFLYLIQEFEPFTFVMGSWAAVAMETYNFPHCALFSTEFLRTYFAAHGYGVFAAGTEAGERDSVSFQNAITAVEIPSAAELADRESRRLLFYARSEPHAKRNMFELGLIAISRAIEQGAFGDEWEYFGIGSVSGRSSVALPGGAQLEILSRRSQADYGEMLTSHDVGLSLMFTPHPSLVPIEMASAGLLTVTNTFDTKTAESLGGISSNLIAAEPSIEGVTAGLAEAIGRVGDHEARVAGSRVDWSRDWEDSFSASVMAEIDALLGRN